MVLLKFVVPNPRSIVLLLGHLGATNNDLEQLSKLFIDKGCTTIATTSPPELFLLNRSLKKPALDALYETVNQIKKHEQKQKEKKRIPLIIHSMSNGGCFLLYEIETTLLKSTASSVDVDSSSSTTGTPIDTTETRSSNSYVLSEEDRLVLLDRMKYGTQIFDSCPCYCRTIWTSSELKNPSAKTSTTTEATSTTPIIKAPSFHSSFPIPSWSNTFRKIYTTVATLSLSTWFVCTLSLTKYSTTFWYHMITSPICTNQIYIYTTADVASDSNAVDELIEYRRQIFHDASNITIHKYSDSGHCQLHKDHLNDYQDAIEAAIQKSIERIGEF